MQLNAFFGPFIFCFIFCVILLFFSLLYFYCCGQLFRYFVECGKKSASMACLACFKVFFSEKRFYF